MRVLAILLIALATTSMWLPIALALPPLENNVSFPAGSFVIPMDEKQAERILVFGYVHALLVSPNPIQIFRVIEPANVTLSTNMTASPKLFMGGPFLVLPGDASKITAIKNTPEFKHVTVGTLNSQQTLNNIFRVRDPTKILVVKGEPAWGRTDLTLDAMKIPYNLTTHTGLAANPSMIFSYSLIVVDCAGWNGHIPPQIADNIRTHVQAGNEVIFTDRALLDMNATFPGYVTLSGVQPTDKVPSAYAYNPPRKYDPTKYGSSADRLAPEYPSQYYNPGPHANEIKVFTESAGYAVSSIPSGKVNEVRILTDTKNFGPASNQYAILAFYFQYGDGIVEGLAFHPQQQVKSVVGNNGYYAVYQLYGNKFVHGPPTRTFSLEPNPTSRSTPQGGSVTYTVTVRSFGAFSSPVTLGVKGLPQGATDGFSDPAPQPPAGGTRDSTLTVTTSLSTPVATYVLNITGRDPSSPPIEKWVLVTLDVTIAPADFEISVLPDSLTINTTESKSATVKLDSVGTFSGNVTLNDTDWTPSKPPDVKITFDPPKPKPLPDHLLHPAYSLMRIDVGPNAPEGTYHFNINGTSGTLRHSTPFTLVIVRKPVPPIPLITLLLILALALLGIILGLAAFFASSRRRRPPAPPAIGPVIVPPPKPQRMYVVPTAAQRVRCPHCGRPVAIEAVYCPYCRHRRGAAVVGVITGPGPMIRGSFTGRRAVWGFVLATASAVLILLNSAALLSPGFWSYWSGIFWWLGGSSLLGQSIATLIGVIAGFTIMSGGIMMLMRRGVIGALITFPFAVLSIIVGGGFLAGAVLGIVAGILGAVGR